MAKTKHDTAKSTAKRPTKKVGGTIANNLASAQTAASLPEKRSQKGNRERFVSLKLM